MKTNKENDLTINDFNNKYLPKTGIFDEKYEIKSLKTINIILTAKNVVVKCSCGHQINLPAKINIKFNYVDHVIFECPSCNASLNIRVEEGDLFKTRFTNK